MPTVVTGSARTALNEGDYKTLNRALKDLCNNYTGTRDFKVKGKDGGNFYQFPHRVGDGITSRFGGVSWPYWYASVVLTSPNSSGVGKRRLLMRVENLGKDYGKVDQLIYSPTHYGDNKKKGVNDFVILSDVSLSIEVGFAYRNNLVPVVAPATIVAPPTNSADTGTVSAVTALIPPPVPSLPVAPVTDPTDDVPDFVKQLRATLGDSYFSKSPAEFFGLTG